MTDIIDGRRVFGPPDDIREVRTPNEHTTCSGNWDPRNMDDLLEAHGVMMEGLRKDAEPSGRKTQEYTTGID